MSANYLSFSQNEIEELITLSKKGDSESFKKLSVYVRNIAFSYFTSKLNQGKIINKEDVDDLTNNVYLSFAEQFEKIEKLENWLRRVLFLTFVNWYKKKNESKTFELDESYYNLKQDYKKEAPFDVDLVLKLLNTLSDDKKNIIHMRLWEKEQFSEIARKMNKNESAVKKMFYRALEELRKKIE